MPQEKVENIAGERDIWTTLLSLLLPQSNSGKAAENSCTVLYNGDSITATQDNMSLI